MPSTFSVVVPTLNEEGNIDEVIQQTRTTGDCEIIVVDGGSSDATLERANEADQILESSPGRAIQQNFGAKHATREILVFLHADCRLSPGFDKAAINALNEGAIAGCFRQQIDHSARKYRMIERGNAWRVRNLGWIYGDQGLFIRKDMFEQLGGFPEIPLMEDLYFSKMLKKKGKLAVVNHPLIVSARRWEKRGMFVQTVSNWSFVALAHLGVSPERLAGWYGNVRESDLTYPPTLSAKQSPQL